MNGTSDAQKSRFNSKFEMLQGEELNSAEILNVINAIRSNISNLHVVSNKELKIEISNTNVDENLAKKLEEFINKDKNIKYNVKVDYDNETGLVKYLMLTILDKKQ